MTTTATRRQEILVGLVVALGLGASACGPGGGDPDAEADADGGRDGSVDGDRADGLDADQPPCPEDMVLIDDGEGAAFCIDRYEHPGVGLVPDTGMAWRFAREACVEARRVLCFEEQWARACAGTSVASCLGPAGPAGARSECVSSFGVFDMAGNVAEWTATPGGAATWFVRGGSPSTEEIGCDFREEIRAESARPDIGFRCCRAPR